ncbi:kelch repeat-containing protein [Streptomyces diastatochromogenes]|nr:kelch repeat-containing protein [Streptomyces diastatochromogenes]
MLLEGGRVLVTGGCTSRSGDSVRALASAEIFDPKGDPNDPDNGSWTPAAPMTDARAGHCALVFKGGKVLVTGGTAPVSPGGEAALAFCEVYDPGSGSAGTWTPVASLSEPRSGHRAVLASDTTALVVGGATPGTAGDGTYDPYAELTVERFDLASGKWTARPATAGGRALHRVIPLGSAKFLVVGGTTDDGNGIGYQSALVYDDSGPGGWSTAAGLTEGPLGVRRDRARGRHGAGHRRDGCLGCRRGGPDEGRTDHDHRGLHAHRGRLVSGGAYSFLPWLRSGIVTHVTEPPTAPSTRATIPVKLVVSGDPLQGSGRLEKPVERRVQLYGPGDVVGVDPRAISRTEPRPWVTNVEPNYLAHIEFYEEDFLWRYSPAAPEATGRLKPWLALIVLEGPGESGEPGEFTEGAGADLPLPFVTVTDPARTLPHPDQLGAWAHVHVSGELDGAVVSDEQRMPAVLNALRAVLRDRPDDACCRLLCPRHLLPNRPYHAFLVPAFETGRLSGLGLPPVLPPDADADFPLGARLSEPARRRATALLPPLVLRHGCRRRLRVPGAAARPGAARPACGPARCRRTAAARRESAADRHA